MTSLMNRLRFHFVEDLISEYQLGRKTGTGLQNVMIKAKNKNGL